jgi:hypothetical protein
MLMLLDPFENLFRLWLCLASFAETLTENSLMLSAEHPR